jgi:hypothetical protein
MELHRFASEGLQAVELEIVVESRRIVFGHRCAA